MDIKAVSANCKKKCQVMSEFLSKIMSAYPESVTQDLGL